MDNEVESSLANRDYDKAITGFSKLELKEEQNSSSTLGPYFYTMYLLVYLIKGDLSNAKYLWKRAPVYLKAATSGSFLSEVWEVAKALWVEDVTTALTKVGSVSWPAEVQTLANELRESIVESELRAVGSAYEQIGVAQLAGKLCMSEQQLVQCAQQRGWGVDQAAAVLAPVAVKPAVGSAVSAGVNESLALLQKATDIAAHLEQQSVRVQSVKT